MHRPNNFAFIDGVNLHLTYENLDWKIDYAKLRNYLSKKHNVTFAHYFLGRTAYNISIYSKLESYGYNLKYKTPSQYTKLEEDCPYCHKVISPEQVIHKSDCDSFMTLEAISNSNIYDKAVIITSDGDFDELVKELILKDKLKIVLAPCKEGCSGLLKSVAKGRIDFMDDHKDELEKIKE